MISPDRFTRLSSSVITSGSTTMFRDVTADATPHTKGSWTQLIAASEHGAEFMMVHVGNNASPATDTTMVLDIGIDPAGGTSYTIILPDYLCGFTATGKHALVPVWIPKGASVAARIAGLISGDVVEVGVELVGGASAGRDRLHRSVLVAYGVTTASSSGVQMADASAHTKGAWTLLGTASRRHSGLIIGWQGADADLPFQADIGNTLVDIGIDPAGGTSYSAVISNFPLQFDNNERIFGSCVLPALMSVPIPSGATIAGRVQTSGLNAGNNLEVAVYAF